MDRIDLAVREYKRIVPEPVERWLVPPVRRLQVWLKDYVCPAIEELIGDRQFREHARSPLDQLLPGVRSEERKLVDDIDSLLVASAQALRDVAQFPEVQRELERLFPPETIPSTVEVLLSDSGAEENVLETREHSDLKQLQAQIRSMAQRCWEDLVSAHDYFWPRHDLLGGMTGRRGQDACMIPVFNPELPLLGNLVARAMLRRIDVWQDTIARFRAMCRQAAGEGQSVASERLHEQHRLSDSLGGNIKRLRKLCVNGDLARLRQSCITLTQVYARHYPDPDLSWLSLPDFVLTEGMQRQDQLVFESNARSLELIAVALTDVKKLRGPQPAEPDAVDMYIDLGHLVLVRHPRLAYWHRKLIEVDWDHQDFLWNALWQLAAKAKSQSSIKDSDVYSDGGSTTRLAKLISRLKVKLPTDLRHKITPVRGKSYRLEVEASRIGLFEDYSPSLADEKNTALQLR